MGKTATFAHFCDVDNPEARRLFARGDILVMLHPDTAWGWVIPLPENRLSLGVVRRDGQPISDPETCFADFLNGSPLLQRILAGARRDQPVRRCSDFSYYAAPSHTQRMAAVGDAHAFLDPVFSSGVSLGLHAARELARVLPQQVNDDQPLQLGDYYDYMARGYAVFERIIERFYRPGWAASTFFMPDKPADMVLQLNSILAGDVWREDNNWQNMMLRARRRTLTFEEEKASVAS